MRRNPTDGPGPESDDNKNRDSEEDFSPVRTENNEESKEDQVSG